MPARPLLVVLSGALLLTGGCSGGEAPPDAPTPRSASEQLAAAKTVLDAAGTVALELTSRDVPARENGVTAAKGSGVISATEPKFAGTITGSIQGVAGTIERIDGGLPAKQVQTLFHLGDGTGAYTVSYGLTKDDHLRTATIVGPFFPGAEATYSLILKDYGKPVEITRP